MLVSDGSFGGMQARELTRFNRSSAEKSRSARNLSLGNNEYEDTTRGKGVWRYVQI
jgi:hypothetical protein